MQNSDHGSSSVPHNTTTASSPSAALEQPSHQTELTNSLAGPSTKQIYTPSHSNGPDDPELLGETDIHTIQARLSELGLTSEHPDISSTLSPRENELLHMVRIPLFPQKVY